MGSLLPVTLRPSKSSKLVLRSVRGKEMPLEEWREFGARVWVREQDVARRAARNRLRLSRVLGHDPLAQSVGQYLDAVLEVKFREDVPEVVLDCILADAESTADLLVGVP